MYFAWTVSPGNLPFLRTGTNWMSKRNASAGANMNPRASKPTMTVGLRGRKCVSNTSSYVSRAKVKAYKHVERGRPLEYRETIEEQDTFLREI